MSYLVLVDFFSEDIHQCEKHRGTEDGGISRRRHFVIIGALVLLTALWIGPMQRHNTPQKIGWVLQAAFAVISKRTVRSLFKFTPTSSCCNEKITDISKSIFLIIIKCI